MHIRCPHCHNAVEVVGEQEFASVNCPSCGSVFDLLPETKSFWLSKRSIGHFELLDLLGSGGFGSVWKARDTKLDRLVAIKVPRIDKFDREYGELFLREARSAAQLRHPQIVAVHEVGREDGTLYIVSDFIQGVTLADRLTTEALTPGETADLVATVADAVHYAHEAGVVHRDLKPHNIILESGQRPLIMDFGLAKRDAGEVTITADGKVLGTPAYMSPEQARGESHHVDRRTDVYSLGVILFELLTGERPFRGNQRMLLHQVIHDEPPSPRKLNSRLPRDLETICLKCMEKSPASRYATARALGDDLRRWRNGESISARPGNVLQRFWRWYSQRTNTVAGAATLFIAALGTMHGLAYCGTMIASGLDGWQLVWIALVGLPILIGIYVKCGLLALQGSRLGLIGSAFIFAWSAFSGIANLGFLARLTEHRPGDFIYMNNLSTAFSFVVVYFVGLAIQLHAIVMNERRLREDRRQTQSTH